THEPFSSTERRRSTAGLSVVTVTSVPARTLVSPAKVNDLPSRLRTTGGGGAAPAPPAGPAPGMAKPGMLGPPGPPGAATASRPTSPVHTAAFHVGLISQALSSATPLFSLLIRMMASGSPLTDPSMSWKTEVFQVLLP